jgi:glutathione S-transferase
MLKLFHAAGSCSLASLIALEEAGAAYELMRMSTRDGDQRRPEYLAVNPKGRVPALVTEQGVLTETPAILAYVAQTHPAANLAPDDPWDFARMQSFNSYLCATVHVAHAHKHRGYRWATEETSFADMRAKVAANEADCFALIEAEYLQGPWVMGEQYTVADGYLYTLTSWLEEDGVDPRQFPRVFDHMQRMQARPAVSKVLADEAP